MGDWEVGLTGTVELQQGDHPPVSLQVLNRKLGGTAQGENVRDFFFFGCNMLLVQASPNHGEKNECLF